MKTALREDGNKGQMIFQTAVYCVCFRNLPIIRLYLVANISC